MTGETKILLGLLGGLVVGGGIVALATNRSSAPAPSPAPSPPPGILPIPPGTPIAPTPATPASSVVWVAATSIPPMSRVRISMAIADYVTFASSLGLSPTAPDGWTQLLAQPAVQQVLATSAFTTWAPTVAGMSPPLPADWPPSDTNAANEYHAEFVYGGVVPLLTSALPVPVLAWVAKSTA